MLSPVPISRVKIHDAFWAPRQEINRTATLPHIYRHCQETGRTGALKRERQPGDAPSSFWESYLAKWMEAAAYSLRTHPDPALEAQVEEIIGRLAKTQQPDGYLSACHTLAADGTPVLPARSQSEDVIERSSRWT